MRTLRARRARPARRGQALILLIGYLLMGGSAAAGCYFLTGLTAARIEKALGKSVEDPQRREAAQVVVADWGASAEAFLERTEERRDTLLELLRRHDAQRAAIDAAFAQQDADVDRCSAQVLDHRFALRAQLTAEEWVAVFRPDE